MEYEKGYARYWAEDVVSELGYDYQNKKAVDWVLRWMKRNELDPEDESVTSMSDMCKEEFLTYIQKYNNDIKKYIITKPFWKC